MRAFKSLIVITIMFSALNGYSQEIELVSDFHNAGWIKDVAFFENRMFLANTYGFEIYDVSEPSQPELLKRIGIDGRSESIATRGNVVYVTDYYTGFYAYDVSDLGSVNQVYDFENDRYTYSQLHVFDDKLFVCAYNYGVMVYDISEPLEPSYIGVYRNITNPIYFVCNQQYGYIIDATGELTVLELRDFYNMRPIGSLDFNSEDLSHLSIHQNYLFVSNDDEGVAIVDVADPANLSIVANAVIESGKAIRSEIYSGFLYVACSSGDGLQVFDIENVEDPELIFTDLDAMSSFYTVNENEGILFCSSRYKGFTTFDLENPAEPLQICNYEFPILLNSFTRFNNRLIAPQGAAGVIFYDLSDRLHPELVVSIDTLSVGSATATEDGHLLLSTKRDTTSFFEIWDINNIDDIHMVASVELNNSYGTNPFEDEQIVCIQNDDNSFQFYDISNVNTPRLLGRVLHDTQIMPYLDPILKEGFLYMGDYSNDLIVYDVRNLNDPQEVFTFDSRSLYDIMIDNDTLYACCYSSTLLFDVSDPLNIELIHTYDYPSITVAKSGSLLLLGNHYDGLNMYSISPDEGAELIQTVDTFGFVVGLDFWGDYLLVNDYYDILIYNINHRGVENSSSSHLPSLLSLSSPYPNPFNATTRIGFTLPMAGDVNLTVFDASGRMVRTLANGSYPAGSHVASWNAESAAAGVYFTQLQANGQQVVKLVNLVK